MWIKSESYRRMMTAVGAILAGSVLACLLVACSGEEGQESEGGRGPDATVNPNAALKEAGKSYWTLRLMDKDYKATYEMELDNESIPFETYLERVQNKGKIDYLSLTVKEVNIDGNKGTVMLDVKCKSPATAKFNTTVNMPQTDQWVLESGRWQHIPPGPNRDFAVGTVSPDVK
ncbi:MAG: hypothetical protein K9M96_10530 [Deltaproteobacteria bacterium]|nr:hypothetical protein [Deltaproteobacteria bacterium]